MREVLIWLFVVAWLAPLEATSVFHADYRNTSRQVSELLDHLLDKTRYDKRLRPGMAGPPLKVIVNMDIKSIGPVSENDESYTMDCYFRQVWRDERLRFEEWVNQVATEEFSLPWLFLDRIWKPDTYFINGKQSYLHRITVPNKFVRLHSDGLITYSMRLTIKASCPMFLRKFPLDSQKCPLIIGSYGYGTQDLLYQWPPKAGVFLHAGVESLAQYDLVHFRISKPDQRIIRHNDVYSIVAVEYLLHRHQGYFVLQVFVPCGLIVCSSWVSFWIDPDAVPARVSLGVTTVLSMTTMGFSGRAQMPKVSYATALDWFVILCFGFVFAVMIEYAVINFIDKITSDITKLLEAKGLTKKKRQSQSQNEPIYQEVPSVPTPSTQMVTVAEQPPIDEPIQTQRTTPPEIEASTAELITTAEEIPDQRDWDAIEIYSGASSIHENVPVVSRGFRQCWEGPLKLLSEARFLPSEADVSAQMLAEDPPEKFSNIDIHARRVFPMAFISLLGLYFILYLYYITDEWSSSTHSLLGKIQMAK